MSDIKIVLKPGLHKFQRSVRDESGKILRTVYFQPGIPLDLDDEELQAVEDSIGNTLLIAPGKEDGSFRHDMAATHECVVVIAEQKLKAGKSLTPIQKAALEFDADQKKMAMTDQPDSDTSGSKDPLAEIDGQIEELESVIKLLLQSAAETADMEQKKSMAEKVDQARTEIQALKIRGCDTAIELTKSEIASMESELETLLAVIDDEQTSEDDAKEAKKEAGTIRGKITRANKSLEKLESEKTKSE